MPNDPGGIRVTISLDEKSVRCLVEHVASVLGDSVLARQSADKVSLPEMPTGQPDRKATARQPIRVSDK